MGQSPRRSQAATESNESLGGTLLSLYTTADSMIDALMVLQRAEPKGQQST